MTKLCDRCQGALQNSSLAICGKCSRHCEWCNAKLSQLNYAQTCGLCKSGEVLGKTTHKLGVERISKSFFRALFSNKKG
jgi:hypothetical protein